jgi:predicted RNA-binding Zn ribbon-like protein
LVVSKRDKLRLPERVGGALVLDFVNTRDEWLRDSGWREFLHGYDDLVAWSGFDDDAGAVDPETAADVHARALALRDGLHGLFAALAAARLSARRDVEAVNAAFRALRTRPQLDADLNVAWTATPDRPLGPVLASAAELLRHGPLDRLRECPGPDGTCGWLFLDRTRNRSRRWCSMAVCGNPAKMRARAVRSREGR